MRQPRMQLDSLVVEWRGRSHAAPIAWKQHLLNAGVLAAASREPAGDLRPGLRGGSAPHQGASDHECDPATDTAGRSPRRTSRENLPATSPRARRRAAPPAPTAADTSPPTAPLPPASQPQAPAAPPPGRLHTRGLQPPLERDVRAITGTAAIGPLLPPLDGPPADAERVRRVRRRRSRLDERNQSVGGLAGQLRRPTALALGPLNHTPDYCALRS